jgi:putative membrane protein
MKRSLLILSLCSALAIAGCKPNKDNDAPAPTAQTPAASSEPTPVGGTATPTTQPVGEASPTPEGAARASSGDDIALGLLGAVDKNEIAAAKQAQDKQVTGAVLEYAKMMEKAHTENLEKTKALGTLAETPDVKQLDSEGEQELMTLGQKSGKDYAAAYIDAMIAGHKDALSLIDSQMMSAASTDPVKQHLTETRTHVEQHLAKAEEIKKAM